jgi:hypothetical protein
MSTTHDTDSTTTTLTTPTFTLATLGYDGSGAVSDLSNRERKAYQQNMAIVPDFDNYGEVAKQESATFTAYSSSGSEYDISLTGEQLCSCLDATMNSPEEGCKHSQKLYKLLNRGTIPAPRERVDEWVANELYQQIVAVAKRRMELRVARETAAHTVDPEYDPKEYDDPIETATAILGGLRETYDDYRDRVDDDVPALPPACRTDQDNEETTESDDE